MQELEDLGGDMGEEEMENIRERVIADPKREGIWYASGHAFYLSLDDGEENEDSLYTPAMITAVEHGEQGGGDAEAGARITRIHIAEETRRSRFVSAVERALSALLPRRAKK